MKCNNCKKEISRVKLHHFNYDGSDGCVWADIQGGEPYPDDYRCLGCGTQSCDPVCRAEKRSCYYVEAPLSATLFEVEECEDEFQQHISCEHCDKFPFDSDHHETHEFAHVVFH